MSAPTKFIIAMVVATASAAAMLPADAIGAEIIIRTAPPPPRAEHVPADRRGYQWVPGRWNWQRNHYVWQSGTYVRLRPGYAYAAPEWVQRDGGWTQRPGGWARRDRDGDGVPNGADRRPNDPIRH